MRHRSSLIFLTVLVCLLISPCLARAEVLSVTVTHPWLALIASFIGGSNVEVASLQEWNAEGELVRPSAKTLRSLPADAHIIALDSKDTADAGLKKEGFPNLRCLYNPFPIAASALDASLSDPSILPFVAQRLLTVLSAWDSSNYPYYQRRLAEFQARLSSSVLAGQQVLRGMAVFDLSGSSSALLQAACCKIERPGADRLAEWSKNLTAFREFLSLKREEGVMIVADGSTPRPLRRALAGQAGVFFLQRPPLGQDYPTFLHDQYISLWQSLTLKKPSSAGTKRR
ncbi:MAG: hypothetical protein K6E38_02325 [Fretibacterium sp.]|nr:hypothetical protein [Fretibacterium sp.]